MFQHFAAEGRSVAASLGRRTWPHREGEGVTAITSGGECWAYVGLEGACARNWQASAYFFAVPR